MTVESFDVVVMGGGPAGAVGATVAGVLGKSVALVERHAEIGGAGINSGTLPSKTLRETALALSGLRSRRLFGVDLSLCREASIADFTGHQRNVSAGERERIGTNLSRFGVRQFHGVASFVNPHRVRIAHADGAATEIEGRMILIATGSSPWRPPEFEFEDDRIHDSDELLELGALPRSLAVIGAGVIGSEYACTFASIGTEVHLIDGRTTLMPFLDGEVSSALAAAMSGAGIHMHLGATVAKCDSSRAGTVRLELSDGSALECEGVLVCAGRNSNTGELELARAGIAPGKRGLIPVNGHYRSQVEHIYAAGDVVGPPALATTGMEQARIAMCHAFGVSEKANLNPLLPTGIYTIPEASMVGESEESLTRAGVDYVAGKARYLDCPRGRILGDESGFLKLLFRRDDMKLVGVHVVGEQATELVHIGMVAMMYGADATHFDRACFNYPTLADLYRHAAYDAMLTPRSATREAT